jgi:hypothetical protein
VVSVVKGERLLIRRPVAPVMSGRRGGAEDSSLSTPHPSRRLMSSFLRESKVATGFAGRSSAETNIARKR